MGAIVWNESFEIGVEAMDEQHKRLVEIYNELHAAMMRGKAHKQMNEILKQLVNYTEMHFAAEEKFMASVEFEDLERHATEHEQLLDKIRVFQKKMELDQERITKPVLKFLEFWLRSHIQGKDLEYAKAAKEREAGTPA
ncbi:MAG TPA: bacteriohemerythrin [Candidatus Krumholzibacteria bacterium]|nr:bacteriohemerythrin [Candidatus Krumholzibacteria bacterium]HRX51901.1 bacteriohemerythrin [Candidatus Krumholzibacteria bacterium]